MNAREYNHAFSIVEIRKKSEKNSPYYVVCFSAREQDAVVAEAKKRGDQSIVMLPEVEEATEYLSSED